jgi:small-conductance mechanosensitive channel
MPDKKHVDIEQLKQQPDVKDALKQTDKSIKGEKVVEKKDKLWFGSYILLLLGFGALYYLFSFEFFGLSENIRSTLQRLTRGALLIILVLCISKAIQIYFVSSIPDIVNRYNLKRILRLIIALIVGFIIVISLFINWQTAIISLGIISLILGFALQTVLSSFIGWIYILVRRPFRVGDRIKIDDATGDVIDVSYLDTTLWEFGGQYLSTDHPSGRIIKFPNSKVIDSMVYNYSWPLFPYIWNEVKFQIAYNSDLEFVAEVMQQVAEEEIGEVMIKRISTYRDVLAQTPVDELDVREHPSVIFRVSENTWIEAIVRYLVVPKEQGRIKTRMIKKMLARLNAEPDRVRFPKDNMR